jgi:enoyl-CoA hydratase
VLTRELNDAILTLTLAHGKANALDLELCQALRQEFDRAGESDDVRALVLTGTGSMFSAGVDLPRLINDGRKYVESFVGSLDAMLRTLFFFPKPVVAAVNGHAIAGGAIMAFACDYRLMSSGRIGVPEALVGVPFPPLALEVVRFAVPPQHLQSMLYLCWTVECDEAKSRGIIDEVVTADNLLIRARSIARQLADIAPDAFRLTKLQIREPFDAENASKEIVDLWAAPETHERIREYLAKTIKKK